MRVATFITASIRDGFEVKKWVLKLDYCGTENATNSCKQHQDLFQENNPKRLGQHQKQLIVCSCTG